MFPTILSDFPFDRSLNRCAGNEFFDNIIAQRRGFFQLLVYGGSFPASVKYLQI